MAPKCLSILGVGLLGGSLGLALKRRVNGVIVVGYSHRRETMDEALRLGAIDRAAGSAAEAVGGADVVVLCTPVGLFEGLLKEIGPALAPGAIVTDVGSTKRRVVEVGERVLPKGARFVGSHPMAGSEKRGVRYASAELFQNAVCITTPTGKTDAGALERVEGLWKLLGMRVTRLSPREHDRRLAEISHLPHALAAALVAMQDDESLALAGNGFRDMTRIAAGDGGLWRDILVENRDNLLDSVVRLRRELDQLLAHLEAPDTEAARQWLDAAAARRKGMGPGSGSGTGPP